MYVILVYDIGQKRVAKACKHLRKYLNWVQNSVFEGEITKGKYQEAMAGLKKIIRKSEDSVLIYQFRTEDAMKKKILGVEKNPVDPFL